MKTPATITRYIIQHRGSVLDEAENGMTFMIPLEGEGLLCLLSWGHGWEQVKVRGAKTFPTWPEICYIKEVVWEPEEAVMNLHLPNAAHIIDDKTVHLWKCSDQDIALPNIFML